MPPRLTQMKELSAQILRQIPQLLPEEKNTRQSTHMHPSMTTAMSFYPLVSPPSNYTFASICLYSSLYSSSSASALSARIISSLHLRSTTFLWLRRSDIARNFHRYFPDNFFLRSAVQSRSPPQAYFLHPPADPPLLFGGILQSF